MRLAVLPLFLTAALAAALAACDASTTGPTGGSSEQAPSPGTDSAVDPLAARDPGASGSPAASGQPAAHIPDPEARPVMQMQVVLDRLGFTPGVVDGRQGISTRNALLGFQESRDLAPTGKLDTATSEALAQWRDIPATRVVTIPDDFAAGPFYTVPDKPEDQAKMPSLGYASLDEKLAERFHTTIETLKALNPGGVPAGAPAPASAAPTASASAVPTATPSTPALASGAPFTPQPGPPSFFRAGQQLRVPNVGADAIPPGTVENADWQRTLTLLGVGSEQPKAKRIVVSKSKGTLKAFDDAGKLIGVYTATMGSRHDPLPLGRWTVKGVARNPPFHYNPKLFWDASPGDEKQKLPPGPNGPVGVVWIDLNKPHYGIHGTPEPQTIGRAQSHGCVRLTNWDAARLAQMVSPGTQVLFEA
jgi:lipoprotein-anchoring transpeptidase ErfK/SrfK